MEQTLIKQIDVSKLYLENLILHLDALTILYREVLRDYARITLDETNYNKCITEMIVVMNHLMPKLKGSGTTTIELLNELKEYLPWTENILLPKVDEKERLKIHKLFKLIIEAYDVLGLTKY